MRKGKIRVVNYRPWFLASSTLVLCIFLYLWIFPSQAVPSARNGSPIYPTLYSDRYITENAKITDSRFEKSYLLKRFEVLANVSSSVYSGTFEEETSKEQGTWLWTPTLDITPAYRDSIIAGAARNGIRTIYLSTDSYLDIFIMPEGRDKELLQQRFDSIVSGFIAKATEYGITVDAEAGWRNWAESGNEYKAFAVLDYALEYNRTHEYKFRGFQYDIEPYLLDEYKKDKRVVLRNFVSLINAAVTRLSGSNLVFSVVIPEFYDGVQGETPKFIYNLRVTYAYDHLLRILERRAGSKVIVMAYRNFALGEDGSIAIARDEIERANKRSTKIVVAQELGNVPPPYITFHNTSRIRYERELGVIDLAFKDEKGYGGKASHYINALLALE